MSSTPSSSAIVVTRIKKVYSTYSKPSARLRQLLLRGLALAVYPYRAALNALANELSREFVAVDEISFDLPKGQTVGVIGLNGSGKSTLLQMVVGTVSPTSGEVKVNGRLAALLELGSGFNPEYTGRENVYLNGQLLGLTIDEIDRRFGDITEFASIGEFINQPVKTYSSGMLMRLAFSVVAHVEPDILVVDEALAVGDFVFQQKCYRRIAELKLRGCSILFVSHDMTAVAQFCDYVHVLRSGKLDFSGKSADAINHFKRISTSVESSSHKAPSSLSLQSSEQVDPIIRHDKLREYGSGKARITSWRMFSSNGTKSDTVIRADEEVTIEMNIAFEADCNDAICGYFITDAKGREIVGTNTWYSGRPLGPQRSGNALSVTFSQIFGLAGGDYMLNLGVSEFLGGQLVAHHRLYDLCVIKVVATKHIVGFFLPPTHIEVNAFAKHE